MKKNYSINTNDYPVLSDEETKSLLMEYRNGDVATLKEKALEKLVLHNMGLIYNAIYSVCKNCNEDLVGFGVEGLISAINKFDLSRDSKLSSYAYMHIYKDVCKGFNETKRQIQVPSQVSDALSLFKKTMAKLESLEGVKPTYRPFSDENDSVMSVMEIEMCQNIEHPIDLNLYKNVVLAYESEHVSSLDYSLENDEGESLTIGDTIAAKPVNNRKEELARAFELAIEEINNSYGEEGKMIAQVLKLKLGNISGLEIARRLGITRGRERSLEEKGLALLRSMKSIEELHA